MTTVAAQSSGHHTTESSLAQPSQIRGVDEQHLGQVDARRLRVSPRVVKRAISKYQARGPGIDRTSYKATLSIDILAPPQDLTNQPSP